MRRLALAAAAVAFASLAGCGDSGGYGLASNGGDAAVESVAFTTANGMVNDFFVAPGGNAPLDVTATALAGSGPAALVIPGELFTWSARFESDAVDPQSLSYYQAGAAPGPAKQCPAMPANVTTQTAVPLVVRSQVASSAALGYSPYALYAGQRTTTVSVAPVPGVTPPYCLVVHAAPVSGGPVFGEHTVVVSDGP